MTSKLDLAVPGGVLYYKDKVDSSYTWVKGVVEEVKSVEDANDPKQWDQNWSKSWGVIVKIIPQEDRIDEMRPKFRHSSNVISSEEHARIVKKDVEKALGEAILKNQEERAV